MPTDSKGIIMPSIICYYIQVIMTHVEPPKEGECMSATSPVCGMYKKENHNKEKEKTEEWVQCPCSCHARRRRDYKNNNEKKIIIIV